MTGDETPNSKGGGQYEKNHFKGYLAEELSRLKREAGQDIVIFGSGELVRTLHELDLIDEYRLMIFPVVLGSGKRLFPGGNKKKVLKLVEAKTLGSGVVLLTYQPERKE